MSLCRKFSAHEVRLFDEIFLSRIEILKFKLNLCLPPLTWVTLVYSYYFSTYCPFHVVSLCQNILRTTNLCSGCNSEVTINSKLFLHKYNKNVIRVRSFSNGFTQNCNPIYGILRATLFLVLSLCRVWNIYRVAQ